MKKSLFFVLFLIMVLALSAAPALADEIQASVNSDPLNSTSLYIADGVTMVGLEDYLRFAGADAQWISPDQFNILENGRTMELYINQSTAKLDGQAVNLAAAPRRNDKGVSIPLRAVAEAFGYSVGWDSEKSLVTLTRQESRDGMSPQEFLAKSSAETQKINTYSMQGSLDIKIQLDGNEKDMPEGSQIIKSDFSGQIQNNPMKVYTRQVMHPQGNIAALEGMTIEMYMADNKIYMMLPGQDKWTVMDMPFTADFIKQQQDIQSNPLKAVEQMKEMGMLASFGNDVTMDGQDYYVINATLDMNKFRESYQKIIGDAMKGLPAQMTQGQDVQGTVQELLKNMQMDYFCSIYINKKTLISDQIKVDIKLDLSIDPSKLGEQSGQTESAPLKIHEDMKGQFEITDPGKAFVEPDVSSAVEAGQLQQEQQVEPQPEPQGQPAEQQAEK